MNQNTSPWVGGHQIQGAFLNSESSIVMTCYTHTLLLKDGVRTRTRWIRSQLVVVAATPRAEASQLIAHWLAFYEPDLAQHGIEVFNKLFDSCVESLESTPLNVPSTGVVN